MARRVRRNEMAAGRRATHTPCSSVRWGHVLLRSPTVLQAEVVASCSPGLLATLYACILWIYPGHERDVWAFSLFHACSCVVEQNTSADWGDAANGNLVLMGAKRGCIPWKLYSYWISLFCTVASLRACTYVRTYVCMYDTARSDLFTILDHATPLCVCKWNCDHQCCIYLRVLPPA